MSDLKPECYVANPCGFAESTKLWYDNVLLPMLSKYVTVLDPWSVNVSHILEANAHEQPELWLNLGDHHYQTIRQSKLMVAILDQEPPDTGTVCEVICAAENNIPVLGYRNDFRSTGEEGLPYNLMLGAAIRQSGGVAVANLVDLELELQRRTTEII